jgi:cbb3-type cytochrome oxidase maturation protein
VTEARVSCKFVGTGFQQEKEVALYYPYFVAYMLVGFGISLLVFFWALGSGQFKDQERARYLPLEQGEEPRASKISRAGRYEAYGLLLLVALGLMATGAVLLFAILGGGKGV